MTRTEYAEHVVLIEEVTGGIKIAIGKMTAFAAQQHQIPQRVKDLFEVLYPKPVKKAEANKS